MAEEPSPPEDPGSRALAYGPRAVNDPAGRVTEDRVTGKAPLALTRDDSGGDEVGGGSGAKSSVTLPSPFPPKLDAKLKPVAASHLLQKGVDGVAATKALKSMYFAVADLSDPSNILYASSRGTTQAFIASTAKLAIFFAAFQLRKVVREAADLLGDTVGKKDVPLFDEMIRQWRKPIGRYFHGTKTSRDSLPVLTQIFEATFVGPGWKIDFATTARGGTGRPFKTRLLKAIAESEDNDAATCTRDLGFPYIHGCLVEAGFRTSSRGLWLALDYGGQYWWPETGKEVGSAQAGTARSLVEMLTLLEFDQLVPGSRADMLTFMAGGAPIGASSYVDEGVSKALSAADKGTLDFRSKVGYTDAAESHCDAAIVKHASPAGAMRYTVALLRGFNEPAAVEAARLLDIAVVASHAPPPPP